MGRKFIDCREFPSEMNCTIALSADNEDELLEAAVQHAITVHGHEDTPDLRTMIRTAMKDGTPPVEAPPLTDQEFQRLDDVVSLVVRLRAHVTRERFSREIENILRLLSAANLDSVARVRELGTGEANRFLREVQGKWPKKGSSRVKQAIDQAVLATSGSPGSTGATP